MPQSITIQKKPQLTESSDYSFLRQEGLKYIEQLGSKLWTDYNIHDPGITVLEALCYAITDLGYRTSLDIKDLLALSVAEGADTDGQYPSDKRQAFFTARHILTVNPWTTDDFRKLLINIDGVKNGWLQCKECACDDICLYANCAASTLQYAETEHKVIVRGLYDVLLEFEEEEKSGNLNSGKIKYNFSFMNGLRLAAATIEMRLPSWAALEKDQQKYKHFRHPSSIITGVAMQCISANKNDNTDIPAIPESVLDNALRKPVYATVNVDYEYMPDGVTVTAGNILFEDVPVNVWFRNTEERRALVLDDLKKALQDTTLAGIFPKYLEKIKRADAVIAIAKQELHRHRNLCEDYCTINAVEVEDVAVCLDMEVEPSADIEAILGEAFYRIDQYMRPDIPFYSLQQLLDRKIPVDEIFEGPALANGFIRNEELKAAGLRTMLYASDVISLLMDIPGVVSVKNFVFAQYDDDGRLIKSYPWSMPVEHNHQPGLYIEASKVLVFKNGLPFLADRNELADVLQVIKGQQAQPKYSVTDNDLPVPHGTYYDLNAYFPVQHSLPLTYGTGEDGLPESANALRKAQAKQLKAYLLFFEQLLVNYLSQLSHIGDLYAIDETVQHSYFSRFIPDGEIDGLGALYNGLDAAIVQQLTETDEQFIDRRNRFLDHMLARFAESFNEYALMLYSYTTDTAKTKQQLIADKIAFLQHFPVLSRDRAKSFNYKDTALVCNSQNTAGLADRIRLLLGYGTAYAGNIELYEEKDTDGKAFERRWRLVDAGGKIYLSSSTRYTDTDRATADQKAWVEIANVFRFIHNASHYQVKKVKKYVLNLLDESGEVIATRKQHFATKAEAEAARDEIIAFAASMSTAEQIFIVEHLLLRPRNMPGVPFPAGDPLLTICIPGDCNMCGEEDPYSFRLTVVVNGEDGLAGKGMAFRRYAEQTIRKETPAHLGVKICWVSKTQLHAFSEVYCAWLAELAQPEPDATELHNRLTALLEVLLQLRNIYPGATLHDCIDGNDDNRVFLGQTAVISDAALDVQISRRNEH